MKLKGKRKWLILAAGLLGVVVEVFAPKLTPVAELVADTVAPPDRGQPTAVERWEAGAAPAGSRP